MKAEKLYQKLERDFIKKRLSDDWAQYMNEIKDFLSDNFKKRSMGLLCDNSKEIKKVYTAVFPTNEVMRYIINKKEKEVMLFVHHPSIWDIRKAPEVFQQMNKKLLKQFKERRISIYNLHVPLDNYSQYSTSNTLAKALEIKIIKPFSPYFGSLCGVIGKTDCKTVQELSKRFQKAVKHRIKLYRYGDNEIKNNKVAIVAGGGNSPDVLRDIKKERINAFVTGISALNSHSKKAHDYARKHKINILGGTHYSTEKFACMAMCNYFRKLGLKSEFIEGRPILEDM